MNTREKMERLKRERDMYLRVCRIYYGYQPRTSAWLLGATEAAGFMSALFGCVVTLYVFAHYDLHPLINFIKSLQYVSTNDVMKFITRTFNFMG